jgi:predicted nucleic acid-binding protein
MVLIDTNVLVDVLVNDPVWADWSIEQMRQQSKVHELVINPIIYAELSLTYESVAALDQDIAGMEIVVQEIPRAALFLAGKAFVKYRRAGGNKGNVLADFFIGAHAAVCGNALLTRDVTRYKNYFPTVRILAP